MSPPKEADETTLPHLTTAVAVAFRVGAGMAIKQLQAPPITKLNKAELDLLDLARRVHNLIVLE